MAPRARPMQERFWEKVRPTGFCWEWTSALDPAGYGAFYCGPGKGVDRAHRVAYKLLVGPIQKGLHLDHLCRNRACCNPDHLEPVTSRENTRRGYAPTNLTYQTNVCRRGHSMDDAYTVRRSNGYVCRRCRQCRHLVDAAREGKK